MVVICVECVVSEGLDTERFDLFVEIWFLLEIVLTFFTGVHKGLIVLCRFCVRAFRSCLTFPPVELIFIFGRRENLLTFSNTHACLKTGCTTTT